MKKLPTYKTQTWLNKPSSSFTGFIVCFSGITRRREGAPYGNERYVRIGDCHSSVTLHEGPDTSLKDWIAKCRKLRDILDKYISRLEKELEVELQ